MEDHASNNNQSPTNEDALFGGRQMEKQYYEDMRTDCKEAVEIATKYLEDAVKYRPFPDVRPGFLEIPANPPQKGVTMQTIFEDVERLLLPGVTRWIHPHFHAYYPSANSYPALCADIIGSSIGGIGFTWASSPVSTELEVAMVDWLAKMLGLPDFYLHSDNGGGGGVLGTTCAEQAVLTMMAARNKAIARYTSKHPEALKYEVLSKLVCYASNQAHITIVRAGLLNLLPIRSLPVNEKFQLTGEALENAIKEDIAMGKIPFYCAATLGTTSCCSFDRLDEIGPVCEKYGIWLHVDAAYAGSAFVCPELRHYLRGIECTSSFVFNPHKWLLTNFDCCVVWFRDAKSVTNTFSADAQYLRYNGKGKMPDYRNWQISFGHKFRSLKLWFVIRKFGIIGLQQYIRQHVRMAQYLESLLRRDGRFEIIADVVLGLVCFRVKNDNEITKEIYEEIEKDGRIHLVTAQVPHPKVGEIFFIRIAITYTFTDEEICDFAYNVISEVTDKLWTGHCNKMANDQSKYSN